MKFQTLCTVYTFVHRGLKFLRLTDKSFSFFILLCLLINFHLSFYFIFFSSSFRNKLCCFFCIFTFSNLFIHFILLHLLIFLNFIKRYFFIISPQILRSNQKTQLIFLRFLKCLSFPKCRWSEIYSIKYYLAVFSVPLYPKINFLKNKKEQRISLLFSSDHCYVMTRK